MGSDQVGVPQRIGGPVKSRRLAVPEPGDALDPRIIRSGRELGALDGRGGQLLVDGGPEHDVMPGQDVAVALELQVVTGQRGSLIAGDEHRGVTVVSLIRAADVDRQTHERLHAGHRNFCGGGGVPVAEPDLEVGCCHWAPP